MPIADANYVLRKASDGALTATAVFEADIGGTPLKGMAFYIEVPVSDTATDQSLIARVRASTASTVATTDVTITERSGLELASGFYLVPFSTRKRSVEIELVVAGTSPDFSLVTVELVLGVNQDWTRTIEFV